MTFFGEDPYLRRRPEPQSPLQRLLGLKWWLFGVFVLAVAMAAAHHAGYRWNSTESLPMGIYREVEGPVQIGDLVAVCLDPVDVPKEHRRLLREGACENGTKPLMKCLVAQEGDLVNPISDGLWVNEWKIPWELPKQHYPLASGGRLKAGQVWLTATHPKSWDSRYFGAVAPLSMVRVEAVFQKNPCADLLGWRSDPEAAESGHLTHVS